MEIILIKPLHLKRISKSFQRGRISKRPKKRSRSEQRNTRAHDNKRFHERLTAKDE